MKKLASILVLTSVCLFSFVGCGEDPNSGPINSESSQTIGDEDTAEGDAAEGDAAEGDAAEGEAAEGDAAE